MPGSTLLRRRKGVLFTSPVGVDLAAAASLQKLHLLRISFRCMIRSQDSDILPSDLSATPVEDVFVTINNWLCTFLTTVNAVMSYLQLATGRMMSFLALEVPSGLKSAGVILDSRFQRRRSALRKLT